MENPETGAKIEAKYGALKSRFGSLADLLSELYSDATGIQRAYRQTRYACYDSDRPSASLDDAADGLLNHEEELSDLSKTAATVGAIIYKHPDYRRLFVLHGYCGTEHIRCKKFGWITKGCYVLCDDGTKKLLTKKILYELLCNVSSKWEKLVDAI